MQNLPQELFDEIVKFLTPHFQLLDDRQAILIPVLNQWEEYHSIDWEAPPLAFTVKLVEQLPYKYLKAVIMSSSVGDEQQEVKKSLCQKIDQANKPRLIERFTGQKIPIAIVGVVIVVAVVAGLIVYFVRFRTVSDVRTVSIVLKQIQRTEYSSVCDIQENPNLMTWIEKREAEANPVMRLAYRSLKSWVEKSVNETAGLEVYYTFYVNGTLVAKLKPKEHEVLVGEDATHPLRSVKGSTQATQPLTVTLSSSNPDTITISGTVFDDDVDLPFEDFSDSDDRLGEFDKTYDLDAITQLEESNGVYSDTIEPEPDTYGHEAGERLSELEEDCSVALQVVFDVRNGLGD